VALSQLKELGEQAIVAVAASLVDGGAVLKAQLIASRFLPFHGPFFRMKSGLSQSKIAPREGPGVNCCFFGQTCAFLDTQRQAALRSAR
jgi:hypothetical protein